VQVHCIWLSLLKAVIDSITRASCLHLQIDLENYARQLRRQRLDKEAEDGRLLGWTKAAEINNGRQVIL
jgi:hypothetical protein